MAPYIKPFKKSDFWGAILEGCPGGSGTPKLHQKFFSWISTDIKKKLDFGGPFGEVSWVGRECYPKLWQNISLLILKKNDTLAWAVEKSGFGGSINEVPGEVPPNYVKWKQRNTRRERRSFQIPFVNENTLIAHIALK